MRTRSWPGRSAAQRQKAVIPDPRNDENLAVAQTHLAMIRFHNRVVDTQLGGVPAAQKFDTAREIVTKHYQWMIRTDYLPRIAKAAALAYALGQPPTRVELAARAETWRPFRSWVQMLLRMELADHAEARPAA